MSGAVNSGREPSATPAARATGFALYAASVRNTLPRIASSLVISAVAGFELGWAWAAVWVLAVWAGLGVGAWLMGAAERFGPAARPGWLWPLTAANSLLSAVLQCLMIAALWETGGAMAQAFALATAFIGASYVLLQYFGHLTLFRLLLAPYALTLAYIAGRLAYDEGFRPGAIVMLLGAAVTLVIFLHFSRRQLDRWSTALKQARRRAQEKELAAEAANAAKSTFLATMSHEIRTPLNGVLGMAQAMAADELSGVQRDRLGVIHRSGEALLAILNDVLDLSKIEAGRLELECIEFDMSEVARGAYSAFTALANKKGLSFSLDIEAARGRYQGDPTRLRQILYNLISNALKFTEQGEIRVTAARDGELLEISVADTGVGIDAENLPKLFRKFDQLDSSTTRQFGGTGLGLSICQELAQLMGGEIGVESERGRGSRFTVRVPLPWVGEEKRVGTSADAPAEMRPMALRVLAAEDNAVNQLVLKTLLHQLGVEPVVVDNGASAVEAWENAHWDVILMDIQMPGMDGLEATARIRELEAASGRRRAPIIALTANAMAHQVEQYMAAGMDGHVAKPIEAEALFEALSAATAQAEEDGGREAGAA